MSNESELIPECPAKSKLMEKYSAAISEFSRAANVLNTRMGVMHKGDYERLSLTMNNARTAAEKIHTELLAHVAEHGC